MIRPARAQSGPAVDVFQVNSRTLEETKEMAALGHVAMSVVREVREALVGATLYLDLLKRQLSGDLPALGISDKIEAALATVDARLADLQSFASDRQPNLQWLDVRHVVESVWDSLAPQIAAQRVETVIDIPPRLCAWPISRCCAGPF